MKLRFCSLLFALSGLILLLPPPLRATDVETSPLFGKIEAGYQSVSTDGNTGRAAEYSFLDSSPTLGLDLRGGAGMQHYIFEGAFLNENDFRAEAHFDRNGVVNINLRTERFFHNLEYIPCTRGAGSSWRCHRTGCDFEWRRASSVHRSGPGKDYGIRLDTSEAHLRGKLKSFPAHLNLRYWRFEKKGSRQLRFVDEGYNHPNLPVDNPYFPDCKACHMQSKTRNIDRVTDEITASLDAHLGPVDIVVEQLYREFRDRDPVPVDSFAGHPLRPVGPYEHDPNPESRVVETTVKAHTSLAGGLTGSASFTIGEWENRSDLASGQPFGFDDVKAETDYYKAAGV